MTPKLAELLGLSNPFRGELIYQQEDFAEGWDEALEDAWEKMEVVCHNPRKGIRSMNVSVCGPGSLVWIPEGEDTISKFVADVRAADKRTEDALAKGASMGTINRFRTPSTLESEDTIYLTYNTTLGSAPNWPLAVWINWPPNDPYQQWAIEGW